MADRVNYSVVHYRNLRQLDKNPYFAAPEAESELVEEALSPDELEETNVTSTAGKDSRDQELRELSGVLNGDEEIHFFTSDYSLSQDKIFIRNDLPETEAHLFGVETDKEHKILNSAIRNMRARAKYLDLKF
ncbi:MAG: hypothetical protein ABEK16_02600 [Candidatus Nanohalobium sp.]